MKRLFKICLSVCAALFLTAQMSVFTSCEDDLAADSYYTFTGEMMSDYLNRADFSLFKRIVERSGKMQFLSARGRCTFFPPVNSGVEAYLEENGYASVEDIPEEYCDTLLKACLVDETILYTSDMGATVQLSNELELPLIIVTSDTVFDDDGMVVSVVNSDARIINSMKNDSVDNGVIHPVDRMLVPNTSVGSSLLDLDHSSFEIFYEALRRTGLLDSMQYFRDQAYEEWKENYPEYIEDIHSGGRWSYEQEGNKYVAFRPEHLDMGYTVFIVRDADLFANYPEYFSPSNTLDENISGMYRLAAEKYGDDQSAEIFGLNKTDTDGRTFKEKYWNEEDLSSRYNPLNMFLSYHILDRLYESTGRFLNPWGIITTLVNPTEWIGTMLDYSILKIEQCYNVSNAERVDEKPVDFPGEFYLNHSYASVYNNGEGMDGAHVTVPPSNFSMNMAYYFLDRFITYDADTRLKVMNTRMRMDMSTLWPELANNHIRLAGNPWEQYTAARDNNTTSGLNYYIPPRYLKHTDVSENTVFFVQRPKTQWWNMGGDEFNFLGTTYDIEFRLPTVPPGNYELRMGDAGMFDRGIAQVYVDGDPVGIPVDLRYQADDSRVGGIYGNDFTNMSPEEKEENARTMKNNGYYRGPRSVYTYNNNVGEQYKVPTYVPGSDCGLMNENAYTFRRKLADVVIEPNKHHTLRFRSVWVQGNNMGCFMIDYIELVPYSICGPGGLGEDDK